MLVTANLFSPDEETDVVPTVNVETAVDEAEEIAEFNLSKLSYKEIQKMTKSYSDEMNAFFDSEGKEAASKQALRVYKENILRYLDGRGATPAGNPIKITEKVRLFQLNRIRMINKALEK